MTSAEVAATGSEPRVTLRRGDGIVAPFRLVRADAERLAALFGTAAWRPSP